MRYDLEEKVEDVIVAFLKSGLPGSIKVYAAFSEAPLQYPACVVMALDADNVTNTALYNSRRGLSVIISILTEAAPEKNGSGTIIKTARERNADLRSSVITLLAMPRLQDGLNAIQERQTSFSMAHLTRSERDSEEKCLITRLFLDVIAQPKETT